MVWSVVDSPPMHAIQSATGVATRALQQEEGLGSVVPGRRADLVATDRDPLTDASALLEVSFVMKDGIVYRG